MVKTIKVQVTKKDYYKVMKVIEPFCKREYVVSKEAVNEIIFECSILKVRRLKAYMDLLILLGLEARMEVM